MSEAILIQRPQRWDNPFDPDMTDAQVDRLLALEPFAHMDATMFPAAASLRDIVRNDTRAVALDEGDILMRRGDYGNSAFLILDGSVRVILSPPLPDRVLGRQIAVKKGHFEALAQLWRNPRQPEVRDTGGSGACSSRGAASPSPGSSARVTSIACRSSSRR